MAAKSKPPFAGLLQKEPNFKQKAFADWIETQTGMEPDLKSVQLALSLTGPWRRSDELANLKSSHVTVREAARIASAERKKQRAAEKAAKLRAQLAELEAAAQGAAAASEAHTDASAEPSNVTPIKKSTPAPAKKAASAAKKAPAKKAAPAAKKAPAKKAAPAASPAQAPAARPASPVSSVVDDDDF